MGVIGCLRGSEVYLKWNANTLDAKLIYTASEAIKHKIVWDTTSGESEWIYIGEGKEVNKVMVAAAIATHFKASSLLYIAVTRQNSFEADKETIQNSLEELAENRSFFIWDTTFRRAIEFYHIGVMRAGQVGK